MEYVGLRHGFKRSCHQRGRLKRSSVSLLLYCYDDAIGGAELGGDCETLFAQCIVAAEPSDLECGQNETAPFPLCASRVTVAKMQVCLADRIGILNARGISCASMSVDIDAIFDESINGQRLAPADVLRAPRAERRHLPNQALSFSQRRRHERAEAEEAVCQVPRGGVQPQKQGRVARVPGPRRSGNGRCSGLGCSRQSANIRFSPPGASSLSA